MGKAKKSLKEKAPTKKLGQAAQLLLLVKRSFMAIGATALFTIILMSIMMVNTVARIEQYDISQALNQYRTESRRLTNDIQAYAVTGDITYLNDYSEKVDAQLREQALELLYSKDLTEAELQILDTIKEKVASLDELEETIITLVLSNQPEQAQKIVFGAEYIKTADEINSNTDAVITQIESRIEAKVNGLRTIQIFCSCMEVSSIFFITLEFIRVIGFANVQLLQPVKKVSEQMVALARGDFEETLRLLCRAPWWQHRIWARLQNA